MSGKYFTEEHATDAFQIWPVLVRAAQNRQTMTYKDLSGPTGIHWRNLRTPLAVIKHYCDENLEDCHLTVLVVNQDTKEPGDGLLDTVVDFDKAREKVFEVAQAPKKDGKDWEIMLQNPGLETLKTFATQFRPSNE